MISTRTSFSGISAQGGVVTLLTTCLLLIVALVVTLGGYKSTFYEIKRTQNEVASRQTHWKAEGAVECGVAQYMIGRTIPPLVTACDSTFNVVPEIILDPANNEVMIIATVQQRRVSRRFMRAGGNLQSGAIQSSSSFVVNSSINISTPDPGLELDDDWDCTAVRFAGSFNSASSIVNSGVIHGMSPYAGFEHKNKDCVEKTVVSVPCSSDSEPICLRSDFKQDEQLNVFKDFFGVDPQYHNLVRDNGEFTVVDLSLGLEGSNATNCGTKIIEQLESGNFAIWVEGSCAISGDELDSLNKLLNPGDSNRKSLSLVVHEGLMSLGGAAEIQGVVFHFNYDFIPTQEAWKDLNIADGAVDHFPTKYGSAAYYQGGAFSIKGGVFFDYPSKEHLSLFRDSLSFHYNRDVVQHTQNTVSVFSWKKGSWRDF